MEGAMKWFERLCRLLEYGPFLAALVPTLLVLLAAGVIIASAEGDGPVTMPMVPVYTES
jgi:hypothetical protein